MSSRPTARKRLVHRRDLRHDVGAVAILVDHLLQAAHLPLDAAKSLLIAILRVGVDRDRLAIAAVVRAAPARRLASLVVRALFSSSSPSRQCPREVGWFDVGRKRRSRRLFDTTLTELNAIAALASTGLRSRPNAG